ncbi:NAD-dependent epimerase/dehydratase family protein [Bacillus salipaludis]|uniref:NAD-dependent epimerase/dehydratase family protein n=1 Tax=Bacillus salipaludis TaxID=2547811 RepID=UPI002E249737|nr:NAD-dependent epimerase/dehydratase family protein [Bacillus salipaludis]
MKVLVTGGAGFIGSHTVDLLVDSGYEVIVIDNLSTGCNANINPKATFINIDINSIEIEEVFSKIQPNILIHLAAQVKISLSINDPYYDAMENVMNTIRLLSLCDKYCFEKVIFSSTAAVYGENKNLPLKESAHSTPVSFYGVSKSTCESYFKLFNKYKNLKYVILRYANVYGPRQTSFSEGGVVSIFMNKMKNDQPVTIYGDGEQTRDFIYVKDLAKANIAAISHGTNEIFNISTQTTTSINQLFQICKNILKKDIMPEYGPAREGDIKHSILDNSKAKIVLNWIPTYTLMEGLLETSQF